jgi:hypothetical protein
MLGHASGAAPLGIHAHLFEPDLDPVAAHLDQLRAAAKVHVRSRGQNT